MAKSKDSSEIKRTRKKYRDALKKVNSINIFPCEVKEFMLKYDKNPQDWFRNFRKDLLRQARIKPKPDKRYRHNIIKEGE